MPIDIYNNLEFIYNYGWAIFFSFFTGTLVGTALTLIGFYWGKKKD